MRFYCDAETDSLTGLAVDLGGHRSRRRDAAATNCPATSPGTPSTSFDDACILASANGCTTSGIDSISVQATA